MNFAGFEGGFPHFVLTENSINCGAAAAHGGVNGAFCIEFFFDGADGGIFLEDGQLEVVFYLLFPAFYLCLMTSFREYPGS